MDDGRGFIMDYKDATLSGNGELGFTLSNGSTISVAVNFSEQDAALGNKKPVAKSMLTNLWNNMTAISQKYDQQAAQSSVWFNKWNTTNVSWEVRWCQQRGYFGYDRNSRRCIYRDKYGRLVY